MLDELVGCIRRFDTRIARFSTLLGINLPGSGALESAGPVPSTSTPLRMSLAVQHLERDLKTNLNRLVPSPALTSSY